MSLTSLTCTGIQLSTQLQSSRHAGTHGILQFTASVRTAEGRKDLFGILVRFVLDNEGYGDEPLVVVYDVRFCPLFPPPARA